MKIVKAGEPSAPRRNIGLAARSFDEAKAQAAALAAAEGFVPRSALGKPAAVLAALMTGAELGIGPMEALRSIHVIDGKPTLSAEFMLARAIQAGVTHQWLASSAKEARIRLRRPGFEPFELAFTMAEAEAAGVTRKDNWRKYPAAMLRARCISAAIRAFCPDVLGAGFYTPEEMGAETDESGTPILVESAPANARGAAPRGPEAPLQPEPQPEPERPKAPARVGHCKTADDLRAWIAAHWPTVLRERGPEAAAVVVRHAESIGVDPSEADVWLGEATPSE